MEPTVADVIAIMDDWAPPALAIPGDSIGLQVGDPDAPAARVAVALDANLMTVRESVQSGVSVLITHHPLYRHEPPRPTTGAPGGRAVLEAAAAGLAVFVAHTNLDRAPGGVNDTLASILGLEVEGDLLPEGIDGDLKVVVFVPEAALSAVREAASGAGAGVIGRYEECSFGVPGTGTFLPREGASPAAGEVGRLNEVGEVRLEMLVPAGYLGGVLRAVRAVHPYEEPACDVYPLRGQISGPGLGKVGRFEGTMTLAEVAERCRQRLDLPSVRVTGDPSRVVGRVAVGSGKTDSLIPAAAEAGAEVFVMGDVGHHAALLAEELGIALVDAGHAGTERLVVPVVGDRLREASARLEKPLEVVGLEVPPAPWVEMGGPQV